MTLREMETTPNVGWETSLEVDLCLLLLCFSLEHLLKERCNEPKKVL
jgi:hypothetical protein